MTAREKFQIGDRVSFSAYGKATFPRRRMTTATVVGFGRKPELVAVRHDGVKSREAYHMDFWDVVPEKAE